MLEFQWRDEWSLNNYDAIEINNKGFYALSVTIPYIQNITSTLKLRILISVIRLLSHEKSSCFVRWLSITNMMAVKTQERVAICT